MQLLPNAESAIVDVVKLTNYILNSEHEEGKHKAFVFKKVPGMTANNVDEMRERILDEIKRNWAKTGEEDRYGERYSVDFEWARNDRTATVLTSWTIRSHEVILRLTSCYIAD